MAGLLHRKEQRPSRRPCHCPGAAPHLQHRGCEDVGKALEVGGVQVGEEGARPRPHEGAHLAHACIAHTSHTSPQAAHIGRLDTPLRSSGCRPAPGAMSSATGVVAAICAASEGLLTLAASLSSLNRSSRTASLLLISRCSSCSQNSPELRFARHHRVSVSQLDPVRRCAA